MASALVPSQGMINARSTRKLWSSPTHGSVNGSSALPWLDLDRTDPAPVVVRSDAVRTRLLTQAYDDLQLFVLEEPKCGYSAGRRLARVRCARGGPPTWYGEHRQTVGIPS